MLCVGVVGHVESFAKATFDSSTMKTFNQYSTVWQVIYFVILHTLTRYGTPGIFLAYIIYLSVRTVIAGMLSMRISACIDTQTYTTPFRLSAIEFLGYCTATLLVHAIMAVAMAHGMPRLGIMAVVVVGIGHVGVFVCGRLDWSRGVVRVMRCRDKVD